MRYVVHGAEAVKFDGLSGDQNSGGLIRLSGSGQVASVVLTNLKNEFWDERVTESPPGCGISRRPSVPQGTDRLCWTTCGMPMFSSRIRLHWADASSSVGGTYPNTLGRDIGALILNLNTGATSPVVTWFQRTGAISPRDRVGAAGCLPRQSVGHDRSGECNHNLVEPTCLPAGFPAGLRHNATVAFQRFRGLVER